MRYGLFLVTVLCQRHAEQNDFNITALQCVVYIDRVVGFKLLNNVTGYVNYLKDLFPGLSGNGKPVKRRFEVRLIQLMEKRCQIQPALVIALIQEKQVEP